MTELHNTDWQTDKTLAERNAHMLKYGLASDVTFLVSNTANDPGSVAVTMEAHKYMLVSASPVFYAMFCGGFMHEDTITVDDVDPNAFHDMLSFIYTEEVTITGDYVLQIMYAAKKYSLHALALRCSDFLYDNLAPTNACMLLEQSQFFEEKPLVRRSTTVLQENTEGALESESFLEITRATLSQILDMECLAILELDLVRHCIRWATAQLVKEGKATDGKAIRQCLGMEFYKLRIPTIPIHKLSVLVNTDTITKDEELQLYRYMCEPIKPDHHDMPFRTMKRTYQLGKSNEIFLANECLEHMKVETYIGTKCLETTEVCSNKTFKIDSIMITLPSLGLERDFYSRITLTVDVYNDNYNDLFGKGSPRLLTEPLSNIAETITTRKLAHMECMCAVIPLKKYNIILEAQKPCVLNIRLTDILPKTPPLPSEYRPRRQRSLIERGELFDSRPLYLPVPMPVRAPANILVNNPLQQLANASCNTAANQYLVIPVRAPAGQRVQAGEGAGWAARAPPRTDAMVPAPPYMHAATATSRNQAGSPLFPPTATCNVMPYISTIKYRYQLQNEKYRIWKDHRPQIEEGGSHNVYKNCKTALPLLLVGILPVGKTYNF